MEDKSKHIARINALLSKTVENGATEAEAMNAIAKATELMAKYQLSWSELDLKEMTARSEKLTFDTPLKEFAARELVGSINQLCEVTILRRGKHTFFVCGLDEDIKMAIWMMNQLVDYSYNSVQQWWRSPEVFRDSSRVTAGERQKLKQSYVIGFSRRVMARVNEIVQSRKQVRVDHSTSNALVPIASIKEDKINEMFANSGIKLKAAAPSRAKFDAFAKAAGYKKGGEAPLSKVEQLK